MNQNAKQSNCIPSPDGEYNPAISNEKVATPSKVTGNVQLLTPSSGARFSSSSLAGLNHNIINNTNVAHASGNSEDVAEIGEIPALGMRDWVLSTPRRKDSNTANMAAIVASGGTVFSSGPSSNSVGASRIGNVSAGNSHLAKKNSVTLNTIDGKLTGIGNVSTTGAFGGADIFGTP